MNGKTVTPVHTEASMIAQRWRACAQEQCALSAAGVYVQLYIGMSMFLYAHVSTAGYFSLLLTAPYLLILWGLARYAGKSEAKWVRVLFAALLLLDGQLIFYALCAMLRDVMPGHSPVFLSLCAALSIPLSLYGNQENALPRLFRALKWVIAGLLLYCAVTSLPYGSPSYFFPLLGAGGKTILTGTAWIGGAVSSGVFPLIIARREECHILIREKSGILLRPLFLALAGAVATYGVSVWLSPFYSLARSEDLGWRLLLPVHMTPSVPAWSMMVLGLLLLFLPALSNSVATAAEQLAHSAGKKQPSLFLYCLLSFLLVPVGVLSDDSALRFLTGIAPLRAPLVLGTLLILSVLRFVKKKKAPPSEAP